MLIVVIIICAERLFEELEKLFGFGKHEFFPKKLLTVKFCP